MTVTAADNLRRERVPWRSTNDAMTAAADLLDAIAALHQRGGPKNWPICACCRESWPCPTARLLHPEEVDRG